MEESMFDVDKPDDFFWNCRLAATIINNMDINKYEADGTVTERLFSVGS